MSVKQLVIAIALSAGLAGCGDDGPPEAPTAGTSLTITLDVDGPGGEDSETRDVACEAGADESACAGLDLDTFAPVPADTACTEIYGGPDEVEVTGTVAGSPVEALLTRGNGCEIERFERLLPLLEELFPEYLPGSALGA